MTHARLVPSPLNPAMVRVELWWPPIGDRPGRWSAYLSIPAGEGARAEAERSLPVFCPRGWTWDPPDEAAEAR